MATLISTNSYPSRTVGAICSAAARSRAVRPRFRRLAGHDGTGMTADDVNDKVVAVIGARSGTLLADADTAPHPFDPARLAPEN